MLDDIQPGDLVTLRKPHPCGGVQWCVQRIGADIGLVCLKCGHSVMLSRRELERRLKTRSSPQPSPDKPDKVPPKTSF